MEERLTPKAGEVVERPEDHEMQRSAVAFSGPLPPPALFGEYEQVCPGAAERILAMAEKEQAYRHEQDLEFMREQMGAVWRGQVFAWVIALVALGVAALVAIFGSGWTAAVLAALIGAGGIAPIIVAFLQTRSERQQEDKEI